MIVDRLPIANCYFVGYITETNLPRDPFLLCYTDVIASFSEEF